MLWQTDKQGKKYGINLEQKRKEKDLKTVPQLHNRYNKISVPSAKGILFVSLFDIVWLESDNCYTTLHLSEGSPLVTSRSIGDFEEMLNELDFCRIHNSTIINLQHLNEYIRGDGGNVVLSDGIELEVSRRRKADLLQKIS